MGITRFSVNYFWRTSLSTVSGNITIVTAREESFFLVTFREKSADQIQLHPGSHYDSAIREAKKNAFDLRPECSTETIFLFTA